MTTTELPPPPPAPSGFEAASPEPVEPEQKGPGARGAFLLVGLLAALGLLAGIPALVVALGFIFMITMHELGHYVAAKSAGMQVTEFFVGFGPRLFSVQRGETEYGVKAIPAGAYVKVTGMSNLEPVDPALESRTYRQGKYWRRMSVALAGSAMHFAMAFITLVVMFSAIGFYGINGAPEDAWNVGRVLEGTSAETLGLEVGDQITSVNGTEINVFDDLIASVANRGGEVIETELVRDGEVITAAAELGSRIEFTDLGMSSIVGPDGWTVYPTAISARAQNASSDADRGSIISWALDSGIVGDDRILAIDGTAVTSPEQLGELLSVVPDTWHELTIERLNTDTNEMETLARDVLPLGDLDPTNISRKGFLGIGPGVMPAEPVGFGSAIGDAAIEFVEVARLSTVGLVNFFSPDGLAGFFGFATEDSGSSSDVAARLPAPSTEVDDENRVLSPLGAIRLGSDSVESNGWASLLVFFVLINVFVGIFNMIPLLPFDGGHAVIATYERLRSWGGRRHFADITKLIPLTYAVVGLMVAVGVMALYLDITNPISF